MNKPAKVSGSVQPRRTKKGTSYYARIRLNGSEFTRLIGPDTDYTLRTAREALHEFMVDLRREGVPGPDQGGRTFGDAAAEWLRHCEQEKRLRPSTLRDYKNVVAGSLLPEFEENAALDQISQDEIETYRSRLLAEGRLSPRTVQKTLVILGGIFKRATRLRWIQVNPVERVEKVKVRSSGEFNVLDPVQVEAVARAAGTPMFKAAIFTAAFTGLRTGELRALRWRDVDFASATLHVRRNRPMGGAEGAPKSGKVRSVPLIDQAARELDVLSRRDHATGSDDLVFCSNDGGKLSENALRNALYEAMEAAGIDRKAFLVGDGFRFHDLRHSFATIAVQAFPLTDVQAYLGHSSIETTLRYSHHVPKHDAATRLSALIESEKQGPAARGTAPQNQVVSTDVSVSDQAPPRRNGVEADA